MRGRLLLASPAALALAILSGSPASGQVAPGSIERTIPRSETQLPGPQSTDIAISEAAPAPTAAISGSFVLSAVNISGATVFSAEELSATFEPYLASRVSQVELDRIVAAITERYRRSGYVLSYAVLPPQAVGLGIIEIQVVEGYVDSIEYEGDPAAGRTIAAFLDPIRTDRPLRLARLEHLLAVARELPGVGIDDIRIARSAENPERHALTVNLSSNRIRGLAYSDNRGSIDGARARLYSSLTLAPPDLGGKEVQFDLFAIPASSFRYVYGRVKGSAPLGTGGTRLIASLAAADQELRLDGPDQHGVSRQISGGIAHPVKRSRRLSIDAQIDLSDWRSVERRADVRVQRDRYQLVRASLDFATGIAQRWTGRIAVSQGVDLFSGTKSGDPLASRPNADARFTKLHGELQFSAPLAPNIQLRLAAAGQLATSALFAAEEFALGGNRFGRAFDFNEIAGDEGFAGLAEIAVRPRLAALPGLEVFAFTDGGRTYRKAPAPGLADEQWLASAGSGARFSVERTMVSGEIGFPLVISGGDRGARLFLSLSRVF